MALAQADLQISRRGGGRLTEGPPKRSWVWAKHGRDITTWLGMNAVTAPIGNTNAVHASAGWQDSDMFVDPALPSDISTEVGE